MKTQLLVSFVGLFVSTCLSYAEETVAEQVARVAAESEKTRKSDHAKKYDAAIDRLEAKYPDCFDEKSEFYKAYSPRFDDALQSKDPTTKDPEWAFHLAEVVAHQLAAKGIHVVVEELPDGEEAIRDAAAINATEFESARIITEKMDQKNSPELEDAQVFIPKLSVQEGFNPDVTERNRILEESAARVRAANQKAADAQSAVEALRRQREAAIQAEQAEQAAAAAGDIKAYLKQARKGQAGMNPALQTRARSGDPYATAEIAHIGRQQNIRRQMSAGSLDADEAERQTERAQNEFDRHVESIEREELLQEMRRQNEELERMNQELERRRYQRR